MDHAHKPSWRALKPAVRCLEPWERGLQTAFGGLAGRWPTWGSGLPPGGTSPWSSDWGDERTAGWGDLAVFSRLTITPSEAGVQPPLGRRKAVEAGYSRPAMTTERRLHAAAEGGTAAAPFDATPGSFVGGATDLCRRHNRPGDKPGTGAQPAPRPSARASQASKEHRPGPAPTEVPVRIHGLLSKTAGRTGRAAPNLQATPLYPAALRKGPGGIAKAPSGL